MTSPSSSPTRRGVLLVQLGSPASPAVSDVRAYLRAFLSDARVTGKDSLVWKLLLHGLILPTRPRRVAPLYARIWDGAAFPLQRHTSNFSSRLADLAQAEGRGDLEIRHGFIIGRPSVAEALEELGRAGCRNVRCLPLFPQHCGATTLSARDAVEQARARMGNPPALEFVSGFCDHPAYIEPLARLISRELGEKPPQKLLLSFHGLPVKRVLAGDPYFGECQRTAQLLAKRIEVMDPQNISVAFQSRFGSEEWLKPAADDTLRALARQGVRSVAVACPSFLADNLETLEEMGEQYKKIFLAAGGKEYRLLPCLNDGGDWCASFYRGLVEPEILKPQKLEPDPEILKIPAPVPAPALGREARSAIALMTAVLFLDLVGFSIIFPLFPKLLEHYSRVEGQDGLFGIFMSGVEGLRRLLGGSGGADIVLFGGLLGSIYSLLQFLAAPGFGTLSDRVGRKPVLLISSLGTAVSYLLWFFSGSFALLFFARMLGGVMAANISTASAVAADVTTRATRARGMAAIGIAFGLGFVVGPALGGMLSLVDLTHYWPALARWGVNPYSMPALFAFVLAVMNTCLISTRFRETLPPERRGKGTRRHPGLGGLFHAETYPGVTRNNFVYFFFLMAFAGVEFTLVFLTWERFAFGNINQAWMFLFIGLTLALVQGGYVRRKAAKVGEKRMAGQGLIMLIPAMLFIGEAPNVPVLYFGLLLLASGMAQAMPCLSSLASLYTPPEEQGRILGVFRSLGSLARVLGPLLGCFLYWKLGGRTFYVVASAFLLLPLWLWRGLPLPRREAGAVVAAANMAQS